MIAETFDIAGVALKSTLHFRTYCSGCLIAFPRSSREFAIVVDAGIGEEAFEQHLCEVTFQSFNEDQTRCSYECQGTVREANCRVTSGELAEIAIAVIALVGVKPPPIIVRCAEHLPPFVDVVEMDDPTRPGWVRTTCRKCGAFLGSRLEENKQPKRQGRKSS